MVIFVDHQSPLSRYYKFSPVVVAGKLISSIEVAFWFSFLVQHSLFTSAERLLSSQSIIDKPESAAIWARKQLKFHNTQVLPSWIFGAADVYYTIMIKLITHGYNSFYIAMSDIIRRYGYNVQFCILTGHWDFTWACGLRRNAAEQSQLPYPGHNVYGKLLERLAKDWASGRFHHLFTLNKLFYRSCLPSTPFKNTVLFLSDSMLRQLYKADGALILAKSGATYGQLAHVLHRYQIRIKDFRFIIICCGTNDARKDPSTWQSSWTRLAKLLSPLGKSGYTDVIINSAISTPKVPSARQHTLWAIKQFHKWLPHKKFHFIDWSHACEKNPFFDGPDQLNYRFFHRDKLHINHAGFRLLWKRWCKISPELETISLALSSDSRLYPNGSA